jgi:hypothetical protein
MCECAWVCVCKRIICTKTYKHVLYIAYTSCSSSPGYSYTHTNMHILIFISYTPTHSPTHSPTRTHTHTHTHTHTRAQIYSVVQQTVFHRLAMPLLWPAYTRVYAGSQMQLCAAVNRSHRLPIRHFSVHQRFQFTPVCVCGGLYVCMCVTGMGSFYAFMFVCANNTQALTYFYAACFIYTYTYTYTPKYTYTYSCSHTLLHTYTHRRP